MGNHDYCEYGTDKSLRNVARNRHVLQYLEEKMGLATAAQRERDHCRGDGEAIALIGVENSSRPPFPDYGDLPRAMTGLPGACSRYC
jgi:hypothetical protein